MVDTLKCRFCASNVFYHDGHLLLTPNPLTEGAVDSCSISCNRCLQSACNVINNVLALPLADLTSTTDTHLHSLWETYDWSDVAHQCFVRFVEVVQQQETDTHDPISLFGLTSSR